MIYVKPEPFYRNGFSISGHANYAEHGQDIVCASVSFLAQVVARELEYYKYGYIEEERSGYLLVYITNYDYAKPYLLMLLRALRTLEKQYPKYITVKEHNHEENKRI